MGGGTADNRLPRFLRDDGARGSGFFSSCPTYSVHSKDNMPASLTNSPAYFNRTEIIGLPNKYAV